MNRLLFDRSTGSLKPNAFARLYATQLIYYIQSTPNLRFDGSESSNIDSVTIRTGEIEDVNSNICAHKAGINALVVDRYDGRL